MAGKQKVTDMTKGDPGTLLFKFTIPMLLGNLFQQLYNLVDSIVIGKFVGTDELGGIGCTGSLSFLIFSLGFGMATGIGVSIAMYFGANEESKLQQAIYNSFYVILAAALMITTVGLFFTKDILIFMKTPAENLPFAVLYLKITTCGSAASLFFNVVSSIMRAFGDSQTQLKFLILACVMNIILDLLFVLGFGMSVMGVGLATVISQFIAAICSFVTAYRSIPYFHFKRSALIPNKAMILKNLKLGLPIAVQSSMIALSCIVLQVVVNGFGATIVAANTAVSKIEQLVQQPFNSLSTALSTYAGQNIGAGKTKRIKQGYRSGLKFILGFSLAMFIIMQCFGKQIMGIFVNQEDVIIIGTKALRITSYFYIFLGLIYISRGTLNGVGDAVYSAINGVLELVGRIGLSKPLTMIPFIGMWGCFLCSGLTWMLTGLVSAGRFLSGKWEKTVVSSKKLN